jgi:hypothetical protein
MSEEELRWQPHPDVNNPGVTVWHVARWIDLLGTRLFTGRPVSDDVWHAEGWREVTGYEPDGLGYLGLGTLTGYTPEQMRAVPHMDSVALSTYLSQAVAQLIEQIDQLGARLPQVAGPTGLSPYQIISGTLQGSFGHIGEIDTLVALRMRLHKIDETA